MDILVYAIIAAVLAWRLYSTLGTKHEDGRTRANPFATGAAPKSDAPQKDLLALPLELPALKSKQPGLLAPPGFAPQSLAGALQAIREAEPGFDEKSFVKGARLAFEMIVHAFAAHEKEALKGLVSPVLYDAFKAAIEANEAGGTREDITQLSLLDAHITGAEIRGRYGYVTMEFVSDQARAEVKNGQRGPAEKPRRVHDVWTFRRELGSADPNWILVETKPA